MCFQTDCLSLSWAGAAMATMLSQSFTAVVLTVFLLKKEALLQERENWKADRGLLGSILRVGIPIGLQSMILTLSNIFVQQEINGFGEGVIAAFTVYFRVETFLYLPIVSFGQAMVTFTGQNVGAGKHDRIRRAFITCNLLAAAVTVGFAVLLLTFGRAVLGLFCSDGDVVAIGLQIISISFPFYFIYAIQEVTGGIVRGMGRTVQSMLIVIGTLCVLRVILLKIFSGCFHTVEMVAAVYPLTWGMAALAFVVYGIFLTGERGKQLKSLREGTGSSERY
ncbi:MAG: hypothetical protein LUF78_06130 [Clostridiales bacterium]|nr:hypothetical protein [Clostridiales bacterium]